MKPATANERKQAERQRYRDAGLIAVTVWVKPANRELIKTLAKDMK
jgi:hypothetical protein